MTNVYETVMKNFTMPGLNGSFTAIIEYYFIVVSLTLNKYSCSEILQTDIRVHRFYYVIYLRGRMYYVVNTFYLLQNGWVESASSDTGGTQQFLVKTDIIIVEVRQISPNGFKFLFFLNTESIIIFQNFALAESIGHYNKLL